MFIYQGGSLALSYLYVLELEKIIIILSFSHVWQENKEKKPNQNSLCLLLSFHSSLSHVSCSMHQEPLIRLSFFIENYFLFLVKGLCLFY